MRKNSICQMLVVAVIAAFVIAACDTETGPDLEDTITFSPNSASYMVIDGEALEDELGTDEYSAVVLNLNGGNSGAEFTFVLEGGDSADAAFDQSFATVSWDEFDEAFDEEEKIDESFLEEHVPFVIGFFDDQNDNSYVLVEGNIELALEANDNGERPIVIADGGNVRMRMQDDDGNLSEELYPLEFSFDDSAQQAMDF